MTLASLFNLGLIVVSSAATAAPTQGWPMLMGGPSHAGRSGAQERFAPAGMNLSWQFDVHAQVSASPVAVGQQLFVAAENGNLYALDLASHKLQWLFHGRAGIGSTPAVANGVVYILGRDGVFQALNAVNGAPLWSFRTQGEPGFSAYGMFGQPLGQAMVPDPWDFYQSSPLVHDGKVYFGSSDEHVYALDARTGRLVWAYKTGGMVHSSPALAGANIVVGSWDGALYALDAASGQQRWRFQTETEQKTSILRGIQASPSVDHGVVYIGSRDGHFYAIDALSGAQKWRYDTQGSWVVSTAAVDDSQVYFGTSDTALLIALDKASGKEKFRHPTKVWTFASPLRVGDAVIGASVKGELFALDVQTGLRRWQYQTAEGGEDAYAIMQAASGQFDNTRLFGSAPHQLQAALEHVKRLGAFLSSPLWHKGQLIVATANGQVLVFGKLAK
ncbi:MAG: PQQ-binding-like beta-propeller repeat protein [Pseudomonadota bacterium]